MDAWYNKYLRIPFSERGVTMQGANCWGLIKCIMENEKGIILPDYNDFYQDTYSDESIKAIAEKIAAERHNRWIDIPNKDHQPFDVVILKMNGLPMHGGVVTKKNHMIHCIKDLNTVHEPFNNMRWGNRVLGFCRYE